MKTRHAMRQSCPHTRQLLVGPNSKPRPAHSLAPSPACLLKLYLIKSTFQCRVQGAVCLLSAWHQSIGGRLSSISPQRNTSLAQGWSRILWWAWSFPSTLHPSFPLSSSSKTPIIFSPSFNWRGVYTVKYVSTYACGFLFKGMFAWDCVECLLCKILT